MKNMKPPFLEKLMGTGRVLHTKMVCGPAGPYDLRPRTQFLNASACNIAGYSESAPLLFR